MIKIFRTFWSEEDVTNIRKVRGSNQPSKCTLLQFEKGTSQNLSHNGYISFFTENYILSFFETNFMLLTVFNHFRWAYIFVYYNIIASKRINLCGETYA